MDTDYKKVCFELFGTDDVEELKKIANKLKNNRNAGRKRKFTEKEVQDIEKMLSCGITINEIAKKYNTSRQIVHKYINKKPDETYTLRLNYMYLQHPCKIIDVDFLNEKIKIENRTDDILHRAFGVVENPTWEEFNEFLKDRCFPETRGNLKYVLKDLGVECYDPLQIIEKTKGKTADDNMWIKIKYYKNGVNWVNTIDLENIKKEKIINHTSKGDQPKWNFNEKWYKADYIGYEALSEFVVSELLKKSNVNEFVSYDLVKIKADEKEYTGCESTNFRKEYEILIPIEKLHRQYMGKGLAQTLAEKETVEEKISYTVNFIEEKTNLNNVGEYFSFLLAIDAFFLNEDRHTNNIAVIRNEKTNEFKMAPIFDNGLSLLSDINDYKLSEDVFKNINKITAKPFDRDFDVQLDTVEKLYGSKLKFYFKNDDIDKFSNELKGVYDEHIIKRVITILYAQKRKYSHYF